MPATPRPVTLRRAAPRRTPARDSCMRFLPQAIANRWTARQLADAACCDPAVAADVLAKASAQIHAEAQQALGIQTQKLAEEARKARTSAIARLSKLGTVLDNLTNSLEAKGMAASAKDVSSAIKAASDLWRHTEALTGLDVAKAVAVKQTAATDGIPVAWDGVAALEALPVASQQGDLTGDFD